MRRHELRRWSTLAILSTLLCTSNAFGQSDEDSSAVSLKPSNVALRRIDSGSALIMAKFPDAKPGSEVHISMGSRTVVLSDAGEGGDVTAFDGVFSVVAEFDFEAFAAANRSLAERMVGQEPVPVFASGSRQVSGLLSFGTQDGSLVVRTEPVSGGGEASEAALPLAAEGFATGETVVLPTGVATSTPCTPESEIIAASLPSVSIPHSLMITDLPVVQDPGRTWYCPKPNNPPLGNPVGEWTFWRLMEKINNGPLSTSDFIKTMFKHWLTDQAPNVHIVPARPVVYDQVIGEWESRSGTADGELLPEFSPFRLLAIVLRSDLGETGARGGSGGYGGGGEPVDDGSVGDDTGDGSERFTAGEGRFVFVLHDGECNSEPLTVILEYKVPIEGCREVRDWAGEWIKLVLSSDYNSDLEALTSVFDKTISQIRTNEFLERWQWELREFGLDAAGAAVVETTVAKEPDLSHNLTPLLASFVDAHASALVAQTHDIPLTFGGADFLAGAALPPVIWDVPPGSLATPSPQADEALFGLGFNTCSGCHTTETNTDFAHVHYNTPAGTPAVLSDFLTGLNQPVFDPRNGVPRTFNDLGRRALKLDATARMECEDDDCIEGNVLLDVMTAPEDTADAVH